MRMTDDPTLVARLILEKARLREALETLAGNHCPLSGPLNSDETNWCGRHEHDQCATEFINQVLGKVLV